MTTFFGVDPGLDGAIAVLDHNSNLLAVHNCPVRALGGGSSARETDLHGLRDLVAQILIDVDRTKGVFAVIEQPPMRIASPGGGFNPNGNIAIVKLTRSAAYWEAMLAAMNVAYEMAAPVTWKSKLGVMKDKDKSLAVAKACALWPASTLTFQSGRGFGTAPAAQGRAEAALIAEYARRQHGGRE